MTSGTTSIALRAGDAVVVRHGSDPETRARLIQTAHILERVRGPGVEALVALEDDGSHTRLVTAFVGGRTLATVPPERPDRAVAMAEMLIDTVARIHRSGVVHGSITPALVVIGRDDVPVLCGFDTAHRPDPAVATRARHQDVTALGRLLVQMFDHVATRPLRQPRTWWTLRRNRRRFRGMIEDPGADLDRRSLVTEPAPAPSRDPRSPARRRRIRGPMAVAVLAVIGTFLIVQGVRTLRGGATPQARGDTIPAATIDGSDVHTAAATYSIGRRGDRVVLGDWDGDGVATPALLRPSTGAVFVYRAWPGPDRPLIAPPVTHVVGAQDLRVRPRQGVDDLEVVDTDGDTVDVDIPDTGTTR